MRCLFSGVFWNSLFATSEHISLATFLSLPWIMISHGRFLNLTRCYSPSTSVTFETLSLQRLDGHRESVPGQKLSSSVKAKISIFAGQFVLAIHPHVERNQASWRWEVLHASAHQHNYTAPRCEWLLYFPPQWAYLNAVYYCCPRSYNSCSNILPDQRIRELPKNLQNAASCKGAL